MENAEEYRMIAEQALMGNWLPVGIVGGLLGIIILIILYVWKEDKKKNAKDHEEYEDAIKQLSETDRKISEVLTKLETRSEAHDRDIERLKDQAS